MPRPPFHSSPRGIPAADGHVGAMFENQLGQLRDLLRGVAQVCIADDHHIVPGLSQSLQYRRGEIPLLRANDHAELRHGFRGLSLLCRPVGRIVVYNDDLAWNRVPLKHPVNLSDEIRDIFDFVVGGNDYRDARDHEAVSASVVLATRDESPAMSGTVPAGHSGIRTALAKVFARPLTQQQRYQCQLLLSR
jgi:hypothetical protein